MTERTPLEPLQTPYRLPYLSNEQLDQLQTATMDILERTGVRFPSIKALKILADHGAGSRDIFYDALRRDNVRF